MKINVKTVDKTYGQALALTLARCLKADVAVDAGPEFEADLNLCDDASEEFACGKNIEVSKFEPVSKLVERLRAEMMGSEGDVPVNVKAVAVTGMGGKGVSTVSSILAALLSELYQKRVLLLSFNGIGGPSERQVYDLLTAGTLDLSTVNRDEYGVFRPEGRRRLNPLGRLTRGETAEILSRLGRISGLDLIVLDVPVASPHWSLCMKAAETVVIAGEDRDGEIQSLVSGESFGFDRVLRFENRREQGTPDMFSETGAALRRFVQEELC